MTKMVIKKSARKGQPTDKELIQLLNASDDQVDFQLSTSKKISKAQMSLQQNLPQGTSEVTLRKTQKMLGGTTVTRQQ